MRKVISIILILALLGGGGFCLYWFVFRKTNDGGYLSNRETLFVVQNVLENNGINLDEYIDNAGKISYTNKSTNAVVYADGERESLTEKFSEKLTATTEDISVSSKTSFDNYSNIIVDAWKMLYSHVFGKIGIAQNVWYEFDTYKTIVENGTKKEVVDNREYFKIYSNEKSEVLISYFNKNEKTLKEVLIDYDLRNTDISYRLIAKETKITDDASGKYVYSYFSMQKLNTTISHSEDVSYCSNEKYIAISDTAFNVNASKFSLLTDDMMYVSENGDEDFKTQVFTYLVERYDLTFFSFEKIENVKTEMAKKLLEFKK